MVNALQDITSLVDRVLPALQDIIRQVVVLLVARVVTVVHIQQLGQGHVRVVQQENHQFLHPHLVRIVPWALTLQAQDMLNALSVHLVHMLELLALLLV